MNKNDNQSEQNDIEARFLRKLTAALISLAKELQDDEVTKEVVAAAGSPVLEKKGERHAC